MGILDTLFISQYMENGNSDLSSSQAGSCSCDNGSCILWHHQGFVTLSGAVTDASCYGNVTFQLTAKNSLSPILSGQNNHIFLRKHTQNFTLLFTNTSTRAMTEIPAGLSQHTHMEFGDLDQRLRLTGVQPSAMTPF